MLTIENNKEEGFNIITVIGEVDASSSIQLDNTMKDALEHQISKTIVDLSKLEYISSAGLGAFMSYIEPYKERNQFFILCGLSDKIKDVFEVLGLNELIPIKSDISEAKLQYDGTQV